jgi:UDP-N-acetylglucosamine 2-epimerase (non-hydrolysing)
MTVFGTRPEAVKMAPIVTGLEADDRFEAITVLTAQHREMLDQVVELFGITPHVDLDLCAPGQTLTQLTSRIVTEVGEVIERMRPDAVLVQGDTTSTFVGALAAFYHQVPVVHVEAGLRTGDLASPFPEEGNRRLVGAIADLHLPPTETSADNLRRENIAEENIFITGNTVIDALQLSLARYDAVPEVIADLDPSQRVLLVTAHRRESWGEPMREAAAAVAELARTEPDLVVVFPIHRNPVVRDAVMPELAGLDNVRVIEPLPYGDFCQVMNRADLILTDSGGVQEEAPSLGKPVLVMRDTTERPEAVDAGTVLLVGTSRPAILREARRLLRDPLEYAAMATAVNPYGDGHAVQRTLDALWHRYAGGPAPEPFAPAAAISGTARR